MSSNPQSTTIDLANTLADQFTRNAVADLWAQLQEAASSGDEQSQAFLRMFGPFAAECLSGRLRS